MRAMRQKSFDAYRRIRGGWLLDHGQHRIVRDVRPRLEICRWTGVGMGPQIHKKFKLRHYPLFRQKLDHLHRLTARLSAKSRKRAVE
jgi:hypothetical protein